MNRSMMQTIPGLLALAALFVGGPARGETFQSLEAMDSSGVSTLGGRLSLQPSPASS